MSFLLYDLERERECAGRPFISAEGKVLVGARWPCGCFALGLSFRELEIHSGACDTHSERSRRSRHLHLVATEKIA